MKSRNELASIDTDVLIIGGGIAGCMAGIKAREHDVRVVIAEKSNTLCSGQAGSGIDHLWAYVPPVHEKMGWTVEDLVEDYMQGVAHGFAKRELIHLIAREIYDRVLDLEKFGVNMRYEDSKLPGKFRLVHQFHSVPSSLNLDGYPLKVKLTRETERRGVEIINRVMMTDLISTDGQISGALGVGTRDAKIYFIKAKSIVLCAGGKTGRMGRESTRSVCFNLHLPGNLSADGKAMALRAGLEIMNMEFLGARRYGLANYETAGRPPRNTWQPAASIVNANGEVVVPKTSFYDWGDLEKGYKIDAAETRRQWIARGATVPQGMPSRRQLEEGGPFYVDCTGGTEEEIRYVEWALSNEGKCRQLLKHLKEEGIDIRRDKLELGLGSRELGNLAAAGLVVDGNLETAMKGLYAAGDEIGGVPFGAASGALVTGWHTGDRAAKDAKKQRGFLPVSDEYLESLRKRCSDMINTRGGCRWREVEERLQNIMDIYCPDVKTEAMMKRGLECLHHTRDIPMRAADAHELSRCLEVRSLLDNSEMTLRTALARKESRKLPCNFYRADFPDQDDKNWFVFSSITLENNELKVSKIPIK